MKLANMKVGKRLGLGFGTAVVLSVAIGAMAWWGLGTLDKANGARARQRQKVVTTQSVLTNMATIRGVVLTLAGEKNSEKRAALKSELQVLRTGYRKELDGLRAAEEGAAGKQKLENVEQKIADWRTVNNQIFEFSDKGKNDDAMSIARTTGGVHQAAIETAVKDYMKLCETLVAQANVEGKRIQSMVNWMLGLLTLVVVAFSSGFGLLVTKSIAAPISASMDVVRRISGGDVTQDVPKELQSRKDEMGELASAMQIMTDSLRKLLGGISGGVQTLASSATELSAVSKQTAAGVASMSEKTNAVASAAEEASASTLTVATGMEESSTSLASVASATEEMSATVGDIAANTAKARSISEQATTQAQTITEQMQKLGQAAQEIGAGDGDHHQHLGADQPAGPERDDRSGACGSGGQGIRRGS